MAETMSAGVYIEEVASSPSTIQPVSTSNVGIVGWAKRGPTDKATLVTSFEQYVKTFGGLTRESLMGHTLAAFYANGGRRAYVVRVVPANATAAVGKIQSTTTNQTIEIGDGTTATLPETATASLLKDNAGASPLVPSSITIRWRSAGTPVVSQQATQRDGTTALDTVGGTVDYEGRIAAASLPAFEGGQLAVVPGTVTLAWTGAGAAAHTVAITAPTAGTVTLVDNVDCTVSFDHATGFFSLHTKAAVDAAAINASFTPATATRVATDNGAGAFSGDATGTVSYADGSYSFATGINIPHNHAPVLATYSIYAWEAKPISKGAWGNDIRIDIVGNANYYDTLTATYARFDVTLYLKNADTGVYQVAETYEEISLDDPTSPVFFPDVINELSDLITITEPGANEAPLSLDGVARVKVIAGGDGSTAGQTITTTLPSGPIQKRSFVLTYTGTDNRAYTIKDNGAGGLTGDIAADGVNTLNLTTGALNVRLAQAVRAGTLVVATYRSAPGATISQTLFAGGAEGSFSGVNWSRTQFTDYATLGAAYKGLYALSRIDEIMQVIVPDFAGDVTVSKDLLDYAEMRASQPSGGDRFIILTTPKGKTAQEAVDWFRYDLAQYSKFAALYWPWVRVADPLSNGRALTVPPLGHIAGIYARTDATKNVGKAPGGIVDGALRYLLGLEYDPTQGDRDTVYPNKINPLISSPQTGLAVWGVRTIAIEQEWRYINARRLFMFLEKSVFNATHWIVFENNGPSLWGRIKTQLVGFLSALHGEGYFSGATPKDAYFVIVDSSNNTTAVIEAGQVIIDVGVAPNRPAEFARFRFQQKSLSA